MSEDKSKGQTEEEILDILPYLRACIDAYKAYENALSKYKSLEREEIYRKSPLLLKLLIKLFESDMEEFLNDLL
jgi:hypothetical protein